jgi:hypothetical protein
MLMTWAEAPMRIKVHDGTVNHGDRPLCESCSHSTIIQGETLDQRIVECRAGIMQALRRSAGFIRGEDLEPRELAAILNDGPDET